MSIVTKRQQKRFGKKWREIVNQQKDVEQNQFERFRGRELKEDVHSEMEKRLAAIKRAGEAEVGEKLPRLKRKPRKAKGTYYGGGR